MPNSIHKPMKSPLEVRLKRNSIIESIHRVHAVVTDSKGRVLLSAGNPNYKTFIRSSLKPFQALPFISSGTVEKFGLNDKGIAIACGSHNGSPKHARETFRILWSSDIDIEYLQCPIPENHKSKLEHNCSGKHAAFLATCKKMSWSLENYLKGDHPLQIEIFRRVSELLAIPSNNILAGRDDCGAPTLRMELCQMAFLYAHLSDSKQAEFEQISRAMIAQPELVAGKGRFDTELMTRAHGQLLSKGGAEGIQCLSKIGEGMGIAIKSEDGSKRAKHAAAIHLLRQLEWMTPIGLQELEEEIIPLAPGVELEVIGKLKFLEN